MTCCRRIKNPAESQSLLCRVLLWLSIPFCSREGGLIERLVVKVVIAAEGSKLSTEIPILENVPEREYYWRSASEITEHTDIRYDEEQPLIALIYGQNQLRSFDLSETASGRDDALAENDYVYYFSFEFSKE